MPRTRTGPVETEILEEIGRAELEEYDRREVLGEPQRPTGLSTYWDYESRYWSDPDHYARSRD